MKNLGGLDREVSLMNHKDTPKQLIVSGITFAPLSNLRNEKMKPFYKRKSLHVAKALKALKTELVGVSLEDLWWGKNHYDRLMKSVGAQVISTNIQKNGEKIFTPYVDLKKGKSVVRVFSLTHSLVKIEGFEAIDPAKALEPYFSSQSESEADIIVVLTDFTLPQEFSKKFPQVNFWVGGKLNGYAEINRRLNDRQFEISPLSRGHQFAHVMINTKKNTEEWIDLGSYEKDQKEIVKYKKNVSQKTSPVLEKYYSDIQTGLKKNPKDYTYYRIKMWSSSISYEDKSNAGSKLIKSFKRENASLALKE